MSRGDGRRLTAVGAVASAELTAERSRHAVGERGAGGVDGAHPEGRGDAHDKHEGDHGPEGEVFAGVEVGRGDVGGA